MISLQRGGLVAGASILLAATLVFPLPVLSFGQTGPVAQRAQAYRWSENITIAPPENGKQRAETELATDSDGRVWLLYLDTDYQQTKNGTWIAWPRRLTALTSTNEGRSFGDPRVLSQMGGNAAIAAAPNGGVYVSWVQYSYDTFKGPQQKITVQHVDNLDADPPLQCPIWTNGQRHDQSAIYVSNDGTLHILGRDLTPSLKDFREQSAIYGQSSDGLRT